MKAPPAPAPLSTAPVSKAFPLVTRALQILTDREVTPQLGLLKSTLLQLDSAFSERDYGASSFRDFADTEPGGADPTKLEDQLRRYYAKCGEPVLIAPVDAASDALQKAQEVFAPALNVTEIAGVDAETYLRAAIQFANDRLYGTLGANIVIQKVSDSTYFTDLSTQIAAMRSRTGARGSLGSCATPRAATSCWRTTSATPAASATCWRTGPP